MRHLAFLFVIATALASCGDVVIGPVTHECVNNPSRGLGSGCGGGGGGR